MANRTPRELIELYWTEVWNNRNADLIRELCADPIVRHDPNSTTTLSLQDQIARVRQQSEAAEPYFEHEVLLADDTYVTSVWNMHTRKGQRIELCGIEVFKAVDGMFTDCWNSSYVAGRWGREGDASVPSNLPAPAMISSLDQITPEWMQAVFQHAGVAVPRISLTGSVPIGHGNLSVTGRTAITYNANAEQAVHSVICKITTDIAAAAGIAAMQDVYRREAAVYAFFGSHPPFATPRCYWSNAGAEGQTLNLVLEDLSNATRPGDQVAGCSQSDALAVGAELSKLHAAYWDDPELASASWLLDRKQGAKQAADVQLEAAAVFRERFENRVADSYLDAIDHFARQAEQDILRLPEGKALIHGEPRVDNVLFEDLPGGPRAWLIDWQFATRGSPMFDLAYFLSGSLTPPDRRAVEEEIIASHQAAISACDPDYSLERARREFKACLPIALHFSVGAILAIPPGEKEDRLLSTLVERNVAALVDWDCTET
jgi:hypothetical protein